MSIHLLITNPVVVYVVEQTRCLLHFEPFFDKTLTLNFILYKHHLSIHLHALPVFFEFVSFLFVFLLQFQTVSLLFHELFLLYFSQFVQEDLPLPQLCLVNIYQVLDIANRLIIAHFLLGDEGLVLFRNLVFFYLITLRKRILF